jgi:hypothetical protein
MTAKEIKEELENKHGWNFSSEENMEMYYELFLDVQKVVLRQPPVVGQSEQLKAFLTWLEKEGGSPFIDKDALIDNWLKSL